ncbi:ABC transporter permease [Chondromyces apiculatus]|uniref:Lipoprotein releasing system transmembrane protein LolC n=1 Tax=Chondromyces apiculatus DSM 436 TaxID=1192034 RepID=A0A017T4K7_9BACT|nr:ABC transporter permease [Chondromyces apiculatus]EYF03937.1 Lipoprotein releasing system transmembrane protein LolC [Chondromyces apiculatus DSM 436]
MSYPFDVALRYMGSKKRAFISVSTVFAILGVALGVAALATVMSVTGGFQAEFREKVLGVNAHVLVLKYSTDFREYRSIMDQVGKIPGVVGVAPFSINPMMLTHGDATATGVLLKGVDPQTSLGVGAAPGGPVAVLDLPRHILPGGELSGLRLPGAKPPDRPGPSLPPVPTLGVPPLGGSGAPSAPSAPPPLKPGIPDKTGSLAPSPLDPALDEHGRDVDLLRALEQRIQDDDRRAAEAPPPPPDGAGENALAEAEDDATDDAAVAAGPVGSVEPEGGYKSVLPEDDEIPDFVDPDLCANPEAVAKMPGIVIGVSLAKNLKLDIGKCVTVTSPTIGFSYSGGQIKPPVAKRFRVIAVFEAGFDQYDSKLVYTDLYEAQAFYDQGDTVTGVEMKVANIDDAPDIAKEVSRTLGSGLYHTMDWEELNHGLFTALRIQQIGMSAVLALIIVVAAFTVVATLIMVVLDKKKEIAVLKAMGATNFAILRIFVYQGGIIGVAGTTLGLLLGLAVCKGLLVYGFPLDPKVYFISHLPVLVRWTEFVITGVIAIAVCLFATIIPSTYAASLHPAEGFRDR